LIDMDRLKSAFHDRYGSDPRLFRAPGRVNLMGDHTDYNEGFVLPMAIDLETVVAGARRDDRHVRVHSINRDEQAEFDLDHPGRPCRGIWLDYIEGVARSLEAVQKPLSGADLLLLSTVPEGAGLSSSAALEVAVGFALLSLSEQKVEPVALALSAQRAEHQYVGTKSGIMDQLVAVAARCGSATLIDCRSLEIRHIPIDLSRVSIIICDTKVEHELSSSNYNVRRAECEQAVELLGQHLEGIRSLRDVNGEVFHHLELLLPDVLRRRCRHVITENERTLSTAEAFSAGDLKWAGQLMFESHNSLRHDYEVSCFELDQMVEAAARIDGVIGARMTGGGFGGSTVNLVQPESTDEFCKKVHKSYLKATGILPSVRVVYPGEKASEVV
jgi:galactokinase